MSSDEDNVSEIRRRAASSGRVSYSDPIILHDSSRRQVLLVPLFIPKTDGAELAIKIVTYRKSAPPADWATNEEKSISLTESAARKLLAGLRDHLRVAQEAGDGSYLVIRVSEGTANLGEHDPKAVATALMRVLSKNEIVEHLADTELSAELLSAFRGAIRLSEMRGAVATLRQLLDSGAKSEQVFQAWCEAHTWAFGSAYVMRDDIREISPGDHLDLLLPTVISGYRDVVELKRPDMAVLHYDESHRNFYFSADVSRAIGQCHRYLDVLHEVAAQGLRDHPEIVAYHPRSIIVIGRSAEWGQEQLRALHGLNRRLSGVTVMTYDQLLAQGERLIELLGSKTNAEPDEEPSLQDWSNEDDPF